MSQRNKNNSIIFLTTLSVYLGLVLVGGVTPSVLAQAATTRNFNVQDEIEFKDDLDKKPDDAENDISLAKDFPALFIQLLDEIRNEANSGKYSAPVQSEFDFETRYSIRGLRGNHRGGTDILDLDFERFVEKAVDEKFKSKVSEISDFVDGKSKGWQIQIKVDNSDLLFKASFTKSNAALYAALLNQEFGFSVLSAKDTLVKQIYENTRVTSENNQVFIVTRLPRGSLDKFVKQDAKADRK
ncbi:MAG TPA: hypothetical protein VK308_12180 [Pyrinomonadaceae bacterium]|nr:hypothetical protein [Pyrinomonadaceae bacterium]